MTLTKDKIKPMLTADLQYITWADITCIGRMANALIYNPSSNWETYFRQYPEEYFEPEVIYLLFNKIGSPIEHKSSTLLLWTKELFNELYKKEENPTDT